jgi:ATP-dependent Clp protease ATP-binding subunit ClpA
MKYGISYDETLVEYLAKVGFDELYGARPLKRAIQDKIEDYISEEVLNGNVVENEEYILTAEDELVKFKDKEIKKSKKKKGTE